MGQILCARRPDTLGTLCGAGRCVLSASAIFVWSFTFAAEPTSWPKLASYDLSHLIADRDNADEEDDEHQLPRYIEELFLGTIVYPQEAGEVQLTGGYLHGNETTGDSTFLFEAEYGITDELQIGVDAATQSLVEDSFQDLQQCSVELYYNFFSDLCSGRSYGLGFEFGLPVDSTEDEPRACVYEPFFVAYQDFDAFAANLSAAVEIADPVAGSESIEVTSDVAGAIFRRVDHWAVLLEADVEFGAGETPVRIAPGLYWQPFDAPLDLAVSLPVGVSRDAPNLGVFALAIYEFPISARHRR